MTYTISDSIDGRDVIKAIVDAPSPLRAVVRYAEDNLPPEELVAYRGAAMKGYAMLRTTNHKIIARAEVMEVAA